MIAVNQLAHGLLGPQTQQLTEANLSVNPDDVSGRPVPSPTASGVTDPPSRRSAASGRRSDAKAARTRAATPLPSPGLTGSKWLQSPDGSVLAVCQAAGAYLQLWVPAQGFRADDPHRGPAAVASVTFERLRSEMILRVSCASGTP